VTHPEHSTPRARPPLARTLGQISIGVLIGCALVPALFELASLIGGISPFKYQGF
jgi:hypothetical protein